MDDAGASVTAPTECYLDWDHDGAGAGDPIDCQLDLVALYRGRSADERPALAERGGDCDDEDSTKAPALAEACDELDNDCDGEVDEDAAACGGPCDAVLEHSPGEPCANGLLGSCAREGSYLCQPDHTLRCAASIVSPSQEVCGDEVDNDCDGQADEADGIDAPLWYQDCDGDGYAASSTGAVRSCAMPPPRATCSWTSMLPQPETKTNWDCDDSRAAYNPAADYALPPEGSDQFDLNCDGLAEPDPGFWPSENVCSSAIPEFLNGKASSCDEQSVGTDGCYVWTTAAGAYVRPGATRAVQLCPDTSYLVQLDPWTTAASACYARNVPRAPVWPCR